MNKIALWLVASLRHGWLSTRRHVHVRTADGVEVTLISMLDAFDFMHLPHGLKAQPYLCALDATHARAMLGLLVRWWVFDAWFGLRLRLCRWAVERTSATLRGADRG